MGEDVNSDFSLRNPPLSRPSCSVTLFPVNKTINAVRRGFKAALHPPPGYKYEAAGKTIVCSHCGTDLFNWVGVAGISCAGYGVMCCRCTHIEYFGTRPKQLD
jgi:hypothetical protein